MEFELNANTIEMIVEKIDKSIGEIVTLIGI